MAYPGSHFNFRVFEFRNELGETHREIRSVYYEHGKPVGYSGTAETVTWDVEEGNEAPHRTIKRMSEALDKPVLTEKDFPKASA